MRVGIIGTGIIAKEHAQAIAMLSGSIKLVAAADIAPDRLQSFCAAFGVSRRYSSAAELIADPEVDLVAVATPPSFHEEAVVAALDAGKYVLCEKPLAQSLASAARIAAAEARHPGHLSVNYQLRYAPQYRRMLWLIENGWIGTVESASVERHGYIPHATIGKGAWWGAWSVAGGGVLMTQMIHELDILLLATGQPRSVNAQMDTRYTSIESEDWIEGKLLFDNGRSARFAASVNSGQMRGGFVVKGSLGTISPGRLTLGDAGREAKALAAVNAALPDTKPASMSLPSRALRKVARKLGAAEKPELSAHALLYRDIAASIAKGAAMPIPASEAMKTLQLCAGAYESAITAKEVALPLDTEAKTYAGVTKEGYASSPRPKPVVIPPVPLLPKTNYVRVGLIGLDTTHVTTFADLLHNPYNGDHIPGAKVVAGFAGGSPDMAASADRVGGFTAELRDKYGVAILDTPEAVADASDIVFILSCDGRTHPGLFASVAGRSRPVFIDKPLAVSLADAQQIYELAAKTNTKIFASSAFRWSDGLVAALNSIRASGEKITGCRVRYWGQIQPTQGRFFWYGIHGADMLMAVMGCGASTVEARTDGTKDYIEIEHKDGRRSTMIGDHYDGTFEVSIDTDKRTIDIPAGGAISARALAAALDVLTPGGYPRLWQASDAGSVSGRPGKTVDPDAAETLDVIALLDAAERSYTGKQKIAL
ncbi:MAG TPA: Gfo/Idh/MocA family oxidoreductase [Rhizomicrobium sp.]